MFQADIQFEKLGNGKFLIRDTSVGSTTPSYRRLTVREGSKALRTYDFQDGSNELFFAALDNQVFIVNYTAGLPVSPVNHPDASVTFMITDSADEFLLDSVHDLNCNCTCSCKDLKKVEEISKVIIFLEAADLRFQRDEPVQAQKILNYINEIQGIVGSCNCNCK